MLKKRSIIIGEYDSASYGWTLAVCNLADAEQKTSYIEKPGGDGSWDLSTVMTDGVPKYRNRTLTVRLELSEGTRADREAVISHLVNLLDGFEWRIIHPDHPGRYLTGRVKVVVNYSDLAHAAVTITANCEPWLYAVEETEITLSATPTPQQITLTNAGRKVLVPTITVSNTTGGIRLQYKTASIVLTPGTYEWPTLVLTPGEHALTYAGSGSGITGTVVITYREAVLR